MSIDTDASFGYRFSFNRQLALGPKDRQLIAPSVRAGQMRGLVSGAPKVRHDFVPALRASELFETTRSPPSRTGLSTPGPSDLRVQIEIGRASRRERV